MRHLNLRVEHTQEVKELGILNNCIRVMAARNPDSKLEVELGWTVCGSLGKGVDCLLARRWGGTLRAGRDVPSKVTRRVIPTSANKRCCHQATVDVSTSKDYDLRQSNILCLADKLILDLTIDYDNLWWIEVVIGL